MRHRGQSELEYPEESPGKPSGAVGIEPPSSGRRCSREPVLRPSLRSIIPRDRASIAYSLPSVTSAIRALSGWLASSAWRAASAERQSLSILVI